MAREEEGRGSTTVLMPIRRRPLTSQPSCRTCCSKCRLASRPCPSPSLPRSTRWDRASTSWSGASVSSSRRPATPTPSLLRRPSPLTRSCEEGAPPQRIRGKAREYIGS
uniref:Uncharacterized protein n=1 Tax=Physcomitrium patens TaxID=3218 RepID=A0A2K1J717_PHYPA|nr:hypothetical protein PHYPA_020429 [Physcomitrium patens]